MDLPAAVPGTMRSVSRLHIENLLLEAKQSERKRAILRLHEHHEPVQRMVNALIPGTYVPPHKHENPDKVELFNILLGRIAVLHFGDAGDITNIILLEEHGPNRIVDIAPRTYHALLPLEPSAALEIIQGPYDPVTHKQFAPWAPREDAPKAQDYMLHLQSVIDNWR